MTRVLVWLCCLGMSLPLAAADDGIAALRRMAAQGNADAQFAVGESYRQEKADTEAAFWLHMAAEQQHCQAQRELGVVYANALGVVKDERQALYWYGKAAEQGDVAAQSALAVAYAYGRGVAIDYKQAIYWAQQAGEQGDVTAQILLGAAYATGETVAKDYKQAVAWYRRAAEQGKGVAQFQVGVGYANGFGVPKDRAQAYAWYALAVSNGYPDAEASRVRMAEKLTPDERATAESLLNEWRTRFIDHPAPITQTR